MSQLGYIAKIIKQQADLVRVAEWYDFDYSRTKSRQFCPWCHKHQTSKSLQLSDELDYWHCHRCGRNGDVIDWVAAHGRCSKGEAIGRIATAIGVDINSDHAVAAMQSALRKPDQESANRKDVERWVEHERRQFEFQYRLWCIMYPDALQNDAAALCWGEVFAREAEIYSSLRKRACARDEVKAAYADLRQFQSFALRGVEDACHYAWERSRQHRRKSRRAMSVQLQSVIRLYAQRDARVSAWFQIETRLRRRKSSRGSDSASALRACAKKLRR